jgi:hypothetical protein
MKNSQTKSLLLTAAMTGLLSMSVPAFASAHNSTTQGTNASNASGKSSISTLLPQNNQQGDKHSCKGKNDCKGQGGCKSGDNGCKGKNSCKGKGGCATDGSKPHFA